MPIPVYSVRVPEYHVKSRPNHGSIGQKIDVCLKQHFLNQKVAIRAIGSQEHPGKSVKDLIGIIKKLGTDRYDPKRSGDRYENIQNKKIDFFALEFKITPRGRYLEHFIEPFYTWPIKSGKKPVRLDVAIVYDRSKVRRVSHRYEGREDVKKDGFVFRDSESKHEAILGIIRIA